MSAATAKGSWRAEIGCDRVVMIHGEAGSISPAAATQNLDRTCYSARFPAQAKGDGRDACVGGEKKLFCHGRPEHRTLESGRNSGGAEA
jgi:hypothetical protein